jgi:hypothetical protein
MPYSDVVPRRIGARVPHGRIYSRHNSRAAPHAACAGRPPIRTVRTVQCTAADSRSSRHSSAVQCSAVQCSAVPCSAVQCSAVPCRPRAIARFASVRGGGGALYSPPRCGTTDDSRDGLSACSARSLRSASAVERTPAEAAVQKCTAVGRSDRSVGCASLKKALCGQ